MWKYELKQKNSFGKRSDIMKAWTQDSFPNHIPFVGQRPFQYKYFSYKSTGRTRKNHLIVGIIVLCVQLK